MGLITRSSQILWLKATNGRLAYKTADDHEPRSATGYCGIVRGVRTRTDRYNDEAERTVIDVLLQDDTDDAWCVITGTLIDSSGGVGAVTVFGRMLLARLAHPACMDRRGKPIELRVFPARNNDRITCCVIGDPETHESLDAYETGADALPTDQLHGVINQWTATAISHYGTFGRDTTTAQPTTETVPEEEMGLPF